MTHISKPFRIRAPRLMASASWMSLIALLGSASIVASCGGSESTQRTAAPPPPPPPPVPEEHVPPPPVEDSELESQVRIIAGVGFSTPESVYYDKKRDVYLVSNINGSSHQKENNGFISKMTPDGEVTLKFIEGGKEQVTLNAPKGLTIVGDTLYVADIDHVRMFDAQSGEPQGEVEFKEASLLNDVATGKDGIIYVSDTGVNEKWETDGKDAIYTLTNGKIEKLISHKEKLGNPNGLLAGDGGTWVVTGTGELFWLTDAGKQEKSQKISGGQNDGIAHTPDGLLLISSWTDGAVYAGKPGEKFRREISGLDAPADIGFDCSRGRVLIPLFKKDSVVIHTLSKASSGDR